MLQKKIDIIVPVYNKALFLNNLFNCLKLLPPDIFNIILVDDGSKDDSYEIMKKAISDNALNHFYLYQKCNGGVSSARNYGLNISISEYIWFFDPDDLVDERFFNDIKKIENLKEDIIVFNYSIQDLKNNSIYEQNFDKYGILSKNEFMINFDALLSVNKNMNYVWNKFYKRSYLNDLKFNEKLILGEDRYFNLDVFSGSGNILVLNVYLYKYFIYPGSTLSQSLSLFKIDNIYIVNQYNIRKLNFTREICKAHIIDQIKVRTIFGENNLYEFYKKEHAKFKIKVVPFYSIQDLILFILVFTRLNVFCYKIFFYLKKFNRNLFLNK
ncbi:glycosyltransferase family 2 protein [Acinetobacter terrae]|uniref:Glycosyltransferase family 2 protein n=1 Tax=Acinetobacter terrae TaxID=2731247 RepID=A0A8E4FEC4_9GAMM|nr:glycosyltransferase family 2 protein [Acinetobacter terrae]NNH38939.1 glycosyltransferase family 2 protein [Acinetobacter terrae]